jgi:putative transposase
VFIRWRRFRGGSASASNSPHAWNDSGKIYGYRKLRDDLRDQGETFCPNRIARLIRLAGIKAQIGYKRRPGSSGGKPLAWKPVSNLPTP